MNAVLCGVLLVLGNRQVKVPTGNFYYFLDKSVPKQEFRKDQSVVMLLRLHGDHSWQMEVAMAEHPFTGTWAEKSGDLSLSVLDPSRKQRLIAVFHIDAQNCLRLTDGPIAGPDGSMKDGRFWKMSPAWEKAALAQEDQDKTVERARSVAGCVNAYIRSGAARLPSSHKQFLQVMLPYRGKETWSDFTYTFKGGKAPGEARWSKTVLGFVRGKGGRAIATMDGGAAWRPG